jgi:hypothetical protein
MDFNRDDLRLPIDKAVHICVTAYVDTLSKLYPGKFPTQFDGYTSVEPVEIEFVRDVYNQIFHPVDLHQAAKKISYTQYLSRDKASIEELYQLKESDMVVDYWNVVFDHLVPVSDTDPEVVVFDIMEDASVERRNSKSARARTNMVVQLRAKDRTKPALSASHL